MLSGQSALRFLPYVMIAVSSWIAYKLFIKPFLSPLRKIPGRTYKPIIGNMFEALNEEAMNSTIKWMTELRSRFIRFYFLYGEERLLAADPEIVKHICVTHSKNYHHSSTSGMLKTLTPDFLLTLNGEAHHNLKQLLNPAFNSQAINSFIPVFDRKTQGMVAQWRGELTLGKEVECTVHAQTSMADITMDAICECGFDYLLDCVSNPENAEVQHMRKILEGFRIRLTDMIPLISWLPNKERQEQQDAMAFFSSTIKKIIRDKRLEMESGNHQNPGDLLSRLLVARDEDGNGLSDDVIYSQVGGFLFAGFETTSIGLTWTLLMLAQYPDVQAKARREVASLLQRLQPITAEIVQEMTYLTAVIKETLRLFPPVAVHFRQAISDDVIQGYRIPAGTKIGLSSGALHRLPENWSEPDEFKPERFLVPYNQYAYLPFSAGPYMCIGHHFAMTEMKVVLARLLVNFRLILPPSYTYRRIRQLTMQPSPPLSLIVMHVPNEHNFDLFLSRNEQAPSGSD